MPDKPSAHAIVIGGSLAGLLAARVLSDHFASVTIIERDAVVDAPEPRKGQPQTRHLHGLLGQGLRVISGYFPDLLAGLQESGLPVLDMGRAMRWYCYGGYRARVALGLEVISTSRPFLEWQVRRRVLARPGVRMLDDARVTRLLPGTDNTRVAGVVVERPGASQAPLELRADLVVDAGGRGSQLPRWLAALGYPEPETSTVKCGIGYATRIYRRDPASPSGSQWVVITPEAPRESRQGGAFPVEGDRWILGLGGWHGDHPPTDEAGFLAFARSLPAPDIYEIARGCEPLSGIVAHTFPASQRRRYERLGRFPDGLVPLGDAVCSFNPVYGQGMTLAALQAAELDQLLRERRGALAGLAGPYFRRIARHIDVAWQLSVGEDFRFPQTVGRKAPGTDLVNSYVARVNRASHHDPVVSAAFLRVVNLIEPPSSLLHPRMMWRVLRAARHRRQPAGAPA
jgi:flavin-dependent dehydrogenase